MAKKVLIASYDIEIRDSIKDCLKGNNLEFTEVASGISLTYKSVELKPDLIIMSFSPANLATYHKIKGKKPEKTSVPIILLMPSAISIPAGAEIKTSDLVKENLLLELKQPLFRENLLNSAMNLLGGLKPSSKTTPGKKAEPTLPSWDDIVQKTSPPPPTVPVSEKVTAAKKPKPEEEKTPEKSTKEKTIPAKPAKVAEAKKPKPEEKPAPAVLEKPVAKKTPGQEAPNEKNAVNKAKSLIDDLLRAEPEDPKEYHLEKSRELIDNILTHSENPVTLPTPVPPEKKTEEKISGKKPLEIIRFDNVPDEKLLHTNSKATIPDKKQSKQTTVDQKPVKPEEPAGGTDKKIPPKEEKKSEETETPVKLKRILLADDETDIRNGIKEALVMEGYDVTTVDNGKELVEVGLTLIPDLIIADVIMPGLSGYRAVGQLKSTASFIKIPVIFMTARVKDEEMYETLKPKGPSYFMPKTFEMEELLDKVNSILRKDS